jgi:hypothetical protein
MTLVASIRGALVLLRWFDEIADAWIASDCGAVNL